jgi:hypothetical protein
MQLHVGVLVLLIKRVWLFVSFPVGGLLLVGQAVAVIQLVLFQVQQNEKTL